MQTTLQITTATDPKVADTTAKTVAPKKVTTPKTPAAPKKGKKAPEPEPKKKDPATIQVVGKLVTVANSKGGVQGTIEEILGLRGIASELMWRLNNAYPELMKAGKILKASELPKGQGRGSAPDTFFDKLLTPAQKADKKVLDAAKAFRKSAASSIATSIDLGVTDKAKIENTVLKQHLTSKLDKKIALKIVSKLLAEALPA